MIAFLLYKLARFWAVHLPLRMAYRVAAFLSMLKYYISPRDRIAVIGNLRSILPESAQKNIHSAARKVFVNFGKYLIDFFRFPLLQKSVIRSVMNHRGIEHLDRALAEGKGVILLSAHLGTWELGGVYLAVLGYPIVVVALPHKHRKVNEFFNHQREALGVEVVPSSGIAVRRIFEAVKQNKLVALVGDRDFGNGGRKMDFLGRSKTIPRGPAALSVRTGAPIVPTFVIRHDDDTHTIEFHEAIKDNRSEQETMQRCVAVIEEQIRQHPKQWLLFREFWNE